MSLNQPRTSDPISLACELDGIVPVERLGDTKAKTHESDGSSGLALRLSIPNSALREQKDQAVAPYQALPVKGPVVNITEHLTPAQDVIEPLRGESTEVGACLPHWNMPEFFQHMIADSGR
jgi:hypothetical protein